MNNIKITDQEIADAAAKALTAAKDLQAAAAVLHQASTHSGRVVLARWAMGLIAAMFHIPETLPATLGLEASNGHPIMDLSALPIGDVATNAAQAIANVTGQDTNDVVLTHVEPPHQDPTAETASPVKSAPDDANAPVDVVAPSAEHPADDPSSDDKTDNGVVQA